MNLPSPLISGKLVRRYKRFLTDVELQGGEIVTALCPNTGSMKSCNTPGSPVLLSRSDNPKRKLKFTWELIFTNGVWVGVNTGFPNKLVKEAIQNGVVKELQGYPEIHSEVKYGQNSRIDLLLERDTGLCYVEVKNVTFAAKGQALFPDAVTTRGQKHLRELMQMVRDGHRALMFYCVQREDAECVRPADMIDPEYGRLLRQAVENGVQAIAYQARITPESILIKKKLPVILD